MDLSSPTLTTNSPLTPVFGNNVQDLLGTSPLHVNPSAIITVNSTNDAVDDSNSGVTTLRDAINQANADTASDLIVFDRSLFTTAQTITLNLGELDITKSLDIVAPRDPLTGGDLVTVSGNNAERVFEIGTGATVSIDGLIVADGSVTNDNGGGIKNSGTLTLDSSIVRNDSVKGISAGGGIFNAGTLEVRNSTISNNSAITTSVMLGGGGGIENFGNLVVSNSTISNNSVVGPGGGISNSNATLEVRNSTISGNSATGSGGGIFNSFNSDSTVNVSNSTISGNSARGSGGGIFTLSGILMVRNSILSGNSASNGGGIGSGGSSTVSNSTISGNSASLNGGGIYNTDNSTVTTSTFMLSNSTISGNSASKNGGGIYNDSGILTLVFSTLTLNQATNGGGVFNAPAVSFSALPPASTGVRNTIIARNFLSTDGINPDVSGNFRSDGYNLIGDSTGSTGFGSPGDIIGTSDNPIDPRLDVLAFNGGATQTIALLQDSPAIDASDPTVLDTDPTTDQRGLPRVSGSRADIGAFEVQV